MSGAKTAPEFALSETTIGIRQLVGLRIGLTVGVHGDGCDLLLGLRPVIPVRFHGGNGIEHVQAGGQLAEGGVLAVQMLGIGVHDEELASGGVGAGGTGHG